MACRAARSAGAAASPRQWLCPQHPESRVDPLVFNRRLLHHAVRPVGHDAALGPAHLVAKYLNMRLMSQSSATSLNGVFGLRRAVRSRQDRVTANLA
jgi:hypothetical protein